MKDYMQEENSTYITGYYVDKDNNIIVSYANKNKDVIPYNSHNEKKILDKMESQLNDISKDAFEWKVFNEKMSSKYATISSLIAAGGLTILTLGNFDIITSIVTLFFYSITLFGVCSCIKYHNLKKDYVKNRYFINNKNKLNENVRKNDNMLRNTSKKTKEFVKSSKEDKPVFNINNFYEIPFKDFSKIEENIKRADIMDYSYEEEVNNNEKSKVRRR